MQGKITVAGRKIRYNVSENEGSKYLCMRLNPNLELDITVPSRHKGHIRTMLKKKRAWLEKRVDELASSFRVFDGKSILYKGKRRRLEIKPTVHCRTKVELHQDTLRILMANDGKPYDLLKDWMSQQTKKYVRKKLASFATTEDAKPQRILIRDTRRWGYCTRDKKVVFSWQLIALPAKLREYVVLHEAVHLREFSHSRKFKQALASLCTDYADREFEESYSVST